MATPQPHTADIDGIVREVLRRLETLRGEGRSERSEGQALKCLTTNEGQALKCLTTNGELVLAGRVVGLSELETHLVGSSSGRAIFPGWLAGRLEGVSRLRIRAGAVVTPAVRDLLRERRIRIVEDDSVQESAAHGGLGAPAAEALLLIADETGEGGLLADRLERQPAGAIGWRIDRVFGRDLTELVCQLTARLASSPHAPRSAAVLLTRQPHAAVCLANRRSGLRAAYARDVEEVRRACGSIAANLLVVEYPSKCGDELPAAMVAEFSASAGRNCPAVWRDALG